MDFPVRGERFCFKARFASEGILCVFQGFKNEDLEQKIRSRDEKPFQEHLQ